MDQIKLIMLSVIIFYSILFPQEELYSINTQCNITPDRVINLPLTINFEALELVDSVINKDDNSKRSKFTYFYNQDYRTITEINYNWDEMEWIFYGRATHTYDFNGNRTTFILEFWEASEWIFDKRYTYTYDSYRNMLSRIFADWNGTEWTWEYMEEYIYDPSGDLSNISKKKWNGTWWISDGKVTYEYDSDGNILSLVYEEVFYGTVIYSRIKYSYDSNGNKLTETTEQWNGTEWIYHSRATWTYDENGNVFTQLEEEWNGTDWVFKNRYTNSYNDNGNVNLIVCELWDVDKWIVGGSTPIIDMKDKFGNIFYCTGPIAEIFYRTITDVEEIQIPEIYILSQNYPNPFNPSTNIKYSIPKQSNVTLKVFDVLGSEVATLVSKQQPQGSYELEFDGSDLTSGIYFYRLQVYPDEVGAGEFVETRKMILLK